MAAPTILAQGTPEQIERLVPPILEGSVGWCQLFSEPGAGSDLAGLTTRAHRDGDRWVINGQKVWSQQAMQSDYGMLLARTDLDVPKHKGISWFAFRARPARRHHPAAAGDDRRRRVQRGVPRRRRRATTPTSSAARATAGPSPRPRCTSSAPASAPAAPTPGSPSPGPRAACSAGVPATPRCDEAPNAKLTVELRGRRRAGARGRPRRRPRHPPGPGPPLHVHPARALERPAGQGRGRAGRRPGGGQHRQAHPDPHREAGGPARAWTSSGPHGLLAGEDGADGGVFAKALVFSPASSIYGGTRRDPAQHRRRALARPAPRRPPPTEAGPSARSSANGPTPPRSVLVEPRRAGTRHGSTRTRSGHRS